MTSVGRFTIVILGAALGCGGAFPVQDSSATSGRAATASVAAGAGADAPRTTSVDPRLSTWVDAYLAGFGAGWGEAYAASGYVLVARHGAPLFAKAYGRADRAKGAAVDAETRFRVYSVSKQFTAVCVLQLVDQGKLALRDAVTTYLPDYRPTFGGAAATVTLHQLLTHTAGVPSFTEDAAFMKKADVPHERAAIFAEFKDKPLSFEPGSAFHYSNSGYFLLATIVERVSGEPYETYLQRHVFGPAKMSRSTTSDPPGDPNSALGYRPNDDDQLVPAATLDLSLAFGAGGLRSTPADLLAWNRALFTTTTLVKDTSRAAMITPEKEGYGYGIGQMSKGGHDYVTHSGSMYGFSSALTHVLDLDVDIVVLSNSDAFSAARASNAILTMALTNRPFPPVQERPLAPLDAATLASIAGKYTLDEPSRTALTDLVGKAELAAMESVIVEVDPRHAFWRLPGEDRIRLVGLGSGELYSRGEDITLKFDRPAAGGRATALTTTQGTSTIRYVRAQ